MSLENRLVALAEAVGQDIGDTLRFEGGTKLAGGNGAVAGNNAIALGRNAKAAGTSAVALGHDTETTGTYAVALGRNAEAASSAVALGRNAKAAGLYSMALGYQAETTGIYAVALGRNAEAASSAVALGLDTEATSSAVALGHNAKAAGLDSMALGHDVRTEEQYSVAIGYQAEATGRYAVALGCQAEVKGINQIQLGRSQSTVYAYGAVQDRSDERDKADIKTTELGLDFIERLRPVEFKWDMREDYRPERPENYSELDDTEKQQVDESRKLASITADGTHKRTRPHHGFIAQEVKQVMDSLGVDFGGYQDHCVTANGEDVLSLGYTEFIAPLVKAVQELSEKVKQLEDCKCSNNS